MAVKAALDDAGVEIPFPYRTLAFKESLADSLAGSRISQQEHTGTA